MHIWDFDMSHEAVAADISDLRLATGLSPFRFAARVGVTRTAVWNWERGKARPASAEVLSALRELASEYLDDA